MRPNSVRHCCCPLSTAYLDVNREPYELTRACSRMLCHPTPISAPCALQVGWVRLQRIVAENMEIYARRMPVADALSRIEALYKPYHACLMAPDCSHSRPFRLFRPDRLPFHAGQYPHCGLGYAARFHHWRSLRHQCLAELSRAALHILEDLGFKRRSQQAYAGGFITEHYAARSVGFMPCRSRSTGLSMWMRQRWKNARISRWSLRHCRCSCGR